MKTECHQAKFLLLNKVDASNPNNPPSNKSRSLVAQTLKIIVLKYITLLSSRSLRARYKALFRGLEVINNKCQPQTFNR